MNWIPSLPAAAGGGSGEAWRCRCRTFSAEEIIDKNIIPHPAEIVTSAKEKFFGGAVDILLKNWHNRLVEKILSLKNPAGIDRIHV